MELKNLGNRDRWPDDSLEQRLVDMTERAGYQFRKSENGSMTVYVCNEARLMYYTDNTQ